jgi:hypothetical protein
MGRGIRQTWSRLLSDQWSTGGSGKPCWSLCIRRNSSLTRKRGILFPLSDETRSCSRLDHRYSPYRLFNLVWQVFQLVSWHCILRDLVTCLQARICNCHRVGPEYLSVTWIYKSRSWFTLLCILLWHTQETPFQSPSYVMMVDATKAASRCSDYVVTSWFQGTDYFIS